MSNKSHTTIASAQQSRRGLLALAGGLAAATAASAVVAVSSARAEGQSEIERLVHQWWAIENQCRIDCENIPKGIAPDEDDELITSISDTALGKQDEVMDRIEETPITTLYEAGLVATIHFSRNMGFDYFDDHLAEALRQFGFDARL